MQFKYNNLFLNKLTIFGIIFYLFICFKFMKINKINKIKVCICTIGKLENLYIREYISHYIKYGVDKIFIFDNNDLNGERFENVINDYIENSFVEIINYRGVKQPQLKAYQQCLNFNYNKYNWIIFYDIDEFIFLKNFSNVKNYLNQERFYKCQSIQLNMVFHNDNELLYYDNRTLFERFNKTKKSNKVAALKTILKGNIKTKITCVHNINNKLKSCNGFGELNHKEKFAIYTKKPDNKFYYIDHFCFKSTEEFINKLNNRGSSLYGKTNEGKLKKIGWYFSVNKITSKKIDYLEKYIKVNLTKYRNKISIIH